MKRNIPRKELAHPFTFYEGDTIAVVKNGVLLNTSIVDGESLLRIRKGILKSLGIRSQAMLAALMNSLCEKDDTKFSGRSVCL